MDDNYFNINGGSAQDYERLLGHRVIIYYRDQRGLDRQIYGKITEIDGDLMWLENIHKRTGELWRGCINCKHCDISLVSTVAGCINCKHCDISLVSTVAGWSGREDARV